MENKKFILDKIVHDPVYWTAKLALKPLMFLGITPNQVTLFSALIFFPLAAWSFAKGIYLWDLIGLLFLFGHYYFDAVDGSLARATGKTSLVGRWLDLVCDYLGTLIIIFGMGYGVYRQTGNIFWLIIICIIFFAKFALSVAHIYYGNKIYRTGDFVIEFEEFKNNSFIDKLIKEFVLPEEFFFFFFYNIRYSLLVFVLINQIPTYLVILAIIFNVRWIVLLWVYARVLWGGKNERRIFKLLRKYFDGINFE